MAGVAQSFVAQRGRDTFETVSTVAPADDMQSDLAVGELVGALMEEYCTQNGDVDWNAPRWQKSGDACV